MKIKKKIFHTKKKKRKKKHSYIYIRIQNNKNENKIKILRSSDRENITPSANISLVSYKLEAELSRFLFYL